MYAQAKIRMAPPKKPWEPSANMVRQDGMRVQGTIWQGALNRNI